MHKRLKNKHGFTIIELLLAIVVIGILSALVVVGYQAYIKNAKKTQITTSVSTYEDATNSLLNENKLYDQTRVNLNDDRYGATYSCITATSATTACCYIYNLSGSIVYYPCINNQLIDDRYDDNGEYLQKGSVIAADIKKYLNNNLPAPLPFSNGTGPDTCTNTGTLNGQSMTGWMQCVTQQITLSAFKAPSGKSKMYLTYFLPPDMDCPSKNIATIHEGYDDEVPIAPKVSLVGAKYTDRKTSPWAYPYTACMESVK